MMKKIKMRIFLCTFFCKKFLTIVVKCSIIYERSTESVSNHNHSKKYLKKTQKSLKKGIDKAGKKWYNSEVARKAGH